MIIDGYHDPEAEMDQFPVTLSTAAVPEAAQAAVERAAGYAAQSMAANTRRAYSSDWADWRAWCDATGAIALPASATAVGAYLADRAETMRVSTLRRRLASISTGHRLYGHRLDTRHPAIRDVLRGIARKRGGAPRRARAATTPLVLAMVCACDDSPLGLRDRALLLLAFAGALRRSEVAALDVGDVEFTAEGVRLTIRRSKTDAEAMGDVLGIVATNTSTCPVAAVRAWVDAAAITSGALFRRVDRHRRLLGRLSGEAVALVVRRRAKQASIDLNALSAHSLRAGFITTAAMAGVPEAAIQRQSRHRSVAVLRDYVRPASVFLGNASATLGL